MTNHRAGFDYANPDSILGLMNSAPLTNVTINGVTYPLGTLSQEQITEISSIGTRLVNGTASKADKWPGHILKALLVAGDPNVDLSSIRDIGREVIQSASKEFMRQCVIAAVDKSKTAGEA